MQPVSLTNPTAGNALQDTGCVEEIELRSVGEGEEGQTRYGADPLLHRGVPSLSVATVSLVIPTMWSL